jgi:hypothetical protein
MACDPKHGHSRVEAAEGGSDQGAGPRVGRLARDAESAGDLLLEEQVEGAAQRLPDGLLRRARGERVQDLLAEFSEVAEDDVLFRGEVAEEAGPGQARLLGDLAATGGRPGPTLTSLALIHGYTTAFWWSAGILAAGAVICGTLLRRGVLAGQGDSGPAGNPVPQPELAAADQDR